MTINDTERGESVSTVTMLGPGSPRLLERGTVAGPEQLCYTDTLTLYTLHFTCAVKRSIGFTIGFHNHGEGPYQGLVLVESAY